jgi:hypothetical protein
VTRSSLQRSKDSVLGSFLTVHLDRGFGYVPGLKGLQVVFCPTPRSRYQELARLSGDLTRLYPALARICLYTHLSFDNLVPSFLPYINIKVDSASISEYPGQRMACGLTVSSELRLEHIARDARRVACKALRCWTDSTGSDRECRLMCIRC